MIKSISMKLILFYPFEMCKDPDPVMVVKMDTGIYEYQSHILGNFPSIFYIVRQSTPACLKTCPYSFWMRWLWFC